MTLVLGNALRAARLRKGLKQRDVAETLSVSRAAVGQWEAGTNDPSSSNLLKLQDLLDLDLSSATQQPNIVRSKERFPVGTDVGTRNSLRPGFDIAVSHLVLDEFGYVRDLSGNPGLIYVRRFEFFDTMPNLYAMLFSSNLLSPKYENGDIVYVDPDQRPVAGEYGVFMLKDVDDPYGGIVQFIRRVVFVDDTRVIMSQSKPERFEEWPLSAIARIARVLPEFELVRSWGKHGLPTPPA